jgi:quercetin dioxygenase-like cupin family protein
MKYSPSPRPTFSEATHIPYSSVTRHLWGEEATGRVSDWIYASTDKVHQLVFGIAPQQGFVHSDEFRTIFAADELLTVLSGTMLLINPETGELHKASPGEGVFFRRDTWHHAVNYSNEPLRVLEYFSPPPSQGTSGSYAKKQTYLEKSVYTRDELIGNWPMKMAETRSKDTMRVIRDQDILWRLEPGDRPVLVGLYVTTENLTAGKISLLPGNKTALRQHGGDTTFYVLNGTLNIHVPENTGNKWFELNEKDGFHVPEGYEYEIHNISGESAGMYFGTAPEYFPRSTR